jgi:hypothetical protein
MSNFSADAAENEREFGVSETCHYRCILLHGSAFIHNVGPGTEIRKALNFSG